MGQLRKYGLLILVVIFGADAYGQANVPQGTPAQIAAIKTLELRALASPQTGEIGSDVMRVFGYDNPCSTPAKQLSDTIAEGSYAINFLVYEQNPCAWPKERVGAIAADNFNARTRNGTIIFSVRFSDSSVFFLTHGTDDGLSLTATALVAETARTVGLAPRQEVAGRTIALAPRQEVAGLYTAVLSYWQTSQDRAISSAERIDGR